MNIIYEIHDEQLPIDNMKTPLEYFHYFFDVDILDMITQQSNLYSTQTIGCSFNFSKQDIKDFIAINLITVFVNMTAFTEYWSQEIRFAQIADQKDRGSYSRVVCNKNKVCIVKWHDNKVVNVASSYISETHMGGVDLVDMLVALYRTEMKSHRWYLPIVSQILDMCV